MYPDRLAYEKALEKRDEIYKKFNTSLEANQFMVDYYNKIATKKRHPNLVSKLDVKESQKWVQLTPYLISNGRRKLKCRKRLACRPTKVIEGYGPKSVGEMIEFGFGPFSNNDKDSQRYERLRLLLRMSYFKDAYKAKVRIFWHDAMYQLKNDDGNFGQKMSFFDQFGKMSEYQFRVVIYDSGGAADYKDPIEDNVESFLFHNIDASDDDEFDEEEETYQKEVEKKGKKTVIKPIEFEIENDGIFLASNSKPQVLRDDDNEIETRLPTKQEEELGGKLNGMLGKDFENGKFTNEITRRPRHFEDPDYVYFRGKWILSPLNYPYNSPEYAGWDFSDETLRGTVDTIDELTNEKQNKFFDVMEENFPKGVHVSQWKDAILNLVGAGFKKDNLRLYSPWGGVFLPEDGELDVEVSKIQKEVSMTEFKKARKILKYAKKI